MPMKKGPVLMKKGPSSLKKGPISMIKFDEKGFPYSMKMERPRIDYID